MILRKESRSQDREAHFVQACAVETHMDMSQETFCVEIYTKKPPDPNPATHFFVRACASQNAHGHFTRTILYGNSQKKCRTPIRRHPFCASRAVEMHIYIAQEQFLYRNLRKNAPHAGYHLDQTPGLNCCREIPLQCGHNVWGINCPDTTSQTGRQMNCYKGGQRIWRPESRTRPARLGDK